MKIEKHRSNKRLGCIRIRITDVGDLGQDEGRGWDNAESLYTSEAAEGVSKHGLLRK
jgi:hypothetical protein